MLNSDIKRFLTQFENSKEIYRFFFGINYVMLCFCNFTGTIYRMNIKMFPIS